MFKTFAAPRFYSKIPNNLKGKKKSSQEWLIRQISDPYVERAKQSNYRCRSCYKLLEIDEKYKILRPGNVVIDVGASPGSFSQVCVQRTNSDGADKNKAVGFVVGIDKLQIYPIPGAQFLGNADFTVKETQDKIKEIIAGRRVNAVLSDMAPNASGIKVLDHENIFDLCHFVLQFAVQVSSVNSSLLMKFWENSHYLKILEKELLKSYESVKYVKPNASRSDSAEKFVLARGFKGSVS